MILGARIVKTGLAVTISMFICNFFDIQPALFAGAATVLNMQPSVGLSLSNAREQLLVHFVSISIAVTLGLTLGGNPLVMGFATILVIQTCKHFKWKGGISGGVMASLFILASPHARFIDHAMIRSLVIFIGVGVALLVNLTIVSPNYRQPLRTKLIELNSLLSLYFYEAVQAYLHLSIPSAEELQQRTKKVEYFFQECLRLYELYRFDINPYIQNRQNKAEFEVKYFNEYLAFNKGLWQRTRDIIFLAEERRERRSQAGDLPISTEFSEILALLENGLGQFMDFNKLLQNKLEGAVVPPAIEPHIWSRLDPILTNWHHQFPTESYYLHALIEVALVTYKIRWAAKESVRLLNYLAD